MNPNACRVALRPRGPLEVFDLTLRLARARWRYLGLLVLVTVLPAWLPLVALCWWLDGHVALVAVPFVLAVPIRAPFTLMGGRLLFADAVSATAVLRDLAGRPWAVPALLFVSAAIGVLGGVTLGVLLALLSVALLYVPEAVLLEAVGLGRAMRRSVHLSAGHLGVALAGASGTWALLLWCALVGEAAGQALTDTILQLGAPFGTLEPDHVTPWFLGGMLLAQPVIALYRLMLYVDVRTRVEGWDLQVGLRAAGLAP